MSDEYGEGAPHTSGRAQPHPGIAPPVPGEEVIHHRLASIFKHEILWNKKIDPK